MRASASRPYSGRTSAGSRQAPSLHRRDRQHDKRGYRWGGQLGAAEHDRAPATASVSLPAVAKRPVADEEHGPESRSSSSAASSSGVPTRKPRRGRPGISQATSPRRMSMTGTTESETGRARRAQNIRRLVAVTSGSPRRTGERLGGRYAYPQTGEQPRADVHRDRVELAES